MSGADPVPHGALTAPGSRSPLGPYPPAWGARARPVPGSRFACHPRTIPWHRPQGPSGRRQFSTVRCQSSGSRPLCRSRNHLPRRAGHRLLYTLFTRAVCRVSPLLKKFFQFFQGRKKKIHHSYNNILISRGISVRRAARAPWACPGQAGLHTRVIVSLSPETCRKNGPYAAVQAPKRPVNLPFLSCSLWHKRRKALPRLA